MYEVKISSRHKKDKKLRWLATDINLNSYTLGGLSLMLQLNKFTRVRFVVILIREKMHNKLAIIRYLNKESLLKLN